MIQFDERFHTPVEDEKHVRKNKEFESYIGVRNKLLKIISPWELYLLEQIYLEGRTLMSLAAENKCSHTQIAILREWIIYKIRFDLTINNFRKRSNEKQ